MPRKQKNNSTPPGHGYSLYARLLWEAKYMAEQLPKPPVQPSKYNGLTYGQYSAAMEAYAEEFKQVSLDSMRLSLHAAKRGEF